MVCRAKQTCKQRVLISALIVKNFYLIHLAAPCWMRHDVVSIWSEPFWPKVVEMGKPITTKPSLLSGKLAREHVKCCHIKTGRCGLCFWAEKRETWQARLKSKWLHATLKGQVARLGCSVCALANAGGPWANFEQKPLTLRLHHLQRHESSKTHLVSLEAQNSEVSSRLAPDLDIFKDALKRMRAGGSQRDGGCSSDKKQQVRWCLSEAAMDIGRETLRDALCIAVTRDERKGRLLVRWRACKPNLTAASGVLGFLGVEGFADDLAVKTKQAIEEFCTPRVNLPRGFVSDEAENKLDRQTERSIRSKTSILVTDAASPELLASGLLSGRRPYASSGGCETYLSSTKVIQRDAPHASCRLLKRPFAASPDLSGIMDEYISGPESFCQRVFHSPLLTAWWQELVPESSSLSCAKHRFASFALPLARVSENMSSMISLCHRIALVRGSAGDWASKLLMHFSGKKALLLAMAADAAATTCDLTRSVDDEATDISELCTRVQHFAHSVQALFVSEKVLQLPTYAKTVCDSLDATPVRIMFNGLAREIRITEADKRDVLKIMKARAFL